MNHTTRYTTLIALLALPALIGCSQLESPAQAAAPGAEDPLGRCSPDETASLCEAACTRMSTCASSSSDMSALTRSVSPMSYSQLFVVK